MASRVSNLALHFAGGAATRAHLGRGARDEGTHAAVTEVAWRTIAEVSCCIEQEARLQWPVDDQALALASIEEPAPATNNEPAKVGDSKTATPAVEDYTEKIGNGLKERERRLTLLNEAMMKLREAGEMEDAGRVEERIRGLLEMPEPSQAGAKLRAEIEQMRSKNDELIVQMVAMEEELKRYRGTSSTLATSRKSSSR